RQVITVGRDTPSWWAIAEVPSPAPALRTMRARSAAPAVMVADRAHPLNVARSASETSNPSDVRGMAHHRIPIFNVKELLTRDTSNKDGGSCPSPPSPRFRRAVAPSGRDPSGHVDRRGGSGIGPGGVQRLSGPDPPGVV